MTNHVGAHDSNSTQMYDARNNPLSALSNEVETALGNLTGHLNERKWGFNDAINIADGFETVWPAGTGGGRITLLESASLLDLVSGSAEDGAGTLTGALTVTIRGVGLNWIRQVETIPLTGLTPSRSTKQWIHINHADVSSAGSVRTNVADITISAVTGGSVQACIPAGYGLTQQMTFAVPAGHKVLVQSFSISAVRTLSGQQPHVSVRIVQHSFGSTEYTGTAGIIFDETFDTAITRRVTGEGVNHVVFLGETIIEVVAATDKDGTIAHGHMEILMVGSLEVQ